MKFSVCQIFAIVLIFGLLFTSAIAPTLPLAIAHTEYETITTQKEVMREVTKVTVRGIYETQEQWSDSAKMYIKVRVRVGTETTTVKTQEGTGTYTTETVTRQKEHSHWYTNPAVITAAIGVVGTITTVILSDNGD